MSRMLSENVMWLCYRTWFTVPNFPNLFGSMLGWKRNTQKSIEYYILSEQWWKVNRNIAWICTGRKRERGAEGAKKWGKKAHTKSITFTPSMLSTTIQYWDINAKRTVCASKLKSISECENEFQIFPGIPVARVRTRNAIVLKWH